MDIRSLQSLPLLGPFIRKFDADISRYGVIIACRRLLKDQNTGFEISCPESTSRILSSGGCLIAFNHPYEVETIAVLAALPDRKDVYLIASDNIRSVMSVSKHIIPVWIDHHAISEKKGKLSGKIARLLSLRTGPDRITAHRQNILSLKQASKIVRNGSVVLLAPEGFRGKDGRWFGGIGHLIAGIGTDIPAHYVSCHVRNTSNLDWFRLIPPFGYILPKISVIFSDPVPIAKLLVRQSDPKKLMLDLEKSYRRWSAGLSKKDTMTRILTPL